MLQSTLTSKGQTTIPAAVRTALKARSGDRITYEVEGDQVTLRVHPGARSLMGSLPSNKGKGRTFHSIRTQTAKASAAKRAAGGGTHG